MGLKAALILSVKDEGDLIWEWVAHHILCGFTDIIVFQNDSTDGTVESLKALHKANIIRYFDNSDPTIARNRNWKAHAYRKIASDSEYQKCDYALALDADEFLCIKTSNGTLTEFLEMVPNVPEVRLNWRIYGSSGFTDCSDELITKRFTKAQAREFIGLNPIGFKTLFTPSAFDHPAMHRPRPFSEEPILHTNGSGLSAHEFQITTRYKSNDPKCQKFAQINHYALRDAKSYILKLAKGRPRNASFRPYAYWRSNNRNDVEDLSLAIQAPKLCKKMDELDQLTGGVLSAQRAIAHKHQQTKFDKIIQHTELKNIYDFCIGKSVPNNFQMRLPIGKDWS